MIFQCFDWWCQKSSKATKKLDAVLTALPVFSSWQMKCLGQRSNGPTVSSDHKIFYHLVSKSSTWFTVNTSPSRLMFFLHLWLFLCHFGKTWGQQLLYSQGVPPQPCSSFIHLQKKKKKFLFLTNLQLCYMFTRGFQYLGQVLVSFLWFVQVSLLLEGIFVFMMETFYYYLVSPPFCSRLKNLNKWLAMQSTESP